MHPLKAFRLEAFFAVVVFLLLVTRFWILRHKGRRREDWVRDIFFAIACSLCLLTTSTLAWFCWRMVAAQERSEKFVDEMMAETAKNMPVDLTKMTLNQLNALQAKLQAQRDASVDALVLMEMLKPAYRKLMFFVWAGYITELWLIKGAFLAFYWRLFSRVQSKCVYLLHITSAACIATYTIVITIHFAWCTPVSRNWTSNLVEFSKISSMDSLTTLTVGSFLNIGTDIMIILLPLLILSSFRLRRREKFGLGFIFAVGILCVVASTVRYVLMYKPYKAPPATIMGLRAAFLWSTVEVVTGLIAFSLPSFREVLWSVYKKGISKRSRTSGGHRNKGSGNSSDWSSSGAHSSSGNPPHGGRRTPRRKLPRHPNTLLTEDMITTAATATAAGATSTCQSPIDQHNPLPFSSHLPQPGRDEEEPGHVLTLQAIIENPEPRPFIHETNTNSSFTSIPTTPADSGSNLTALPPLRTPPLRQFPTAAPHQQYHTSPLTKPQPAFAVSQHSYPSPGRLDAIITSSPSPPPSYEYQRPPQARTAPARRPVPGPVSAPPPDSPST